MEITEITPPRSAGRSLAKRGGGAPSATHTPDNPGCPSSSGHYTPDNPTYPYASGHFRELAPLYVHPPLADVLEAVHRFHDRVRAHPVHALGHDVRVVRLVQEDRGRGIAHEVLEVRVRRL